MNGFPWYVAEQVSRLLDPAERSAVLGDLTESGESGWRALIGLLGLVARRQAAWWKDWRPWSALAGLAPLGFLLTRHSARVAHLSAIYIWLYVDNWRMDDIGNSGFWRLLAHECAPILVSYLALMLWSWAGGMAIGVLALRAAGVNGVLFCLGLALADFFPAPHFGFGAQDAVFAVTFYRTGYPLMVQAVLVMLPALWGMRLGRGRSPLLLW